MTKMGSWLRFFCSLFVISTTYANQNIIDLIAKENLKTLTQISSNTEDTLNSLITRDKKFYQVLEDTLKQQQNLRPEAKRRFVFTLLSQYERLNPTIDTYVLDTTSWQDLELLSGPKSNLSHYLAKQIDRTSTEIGRALFFKRLIQPTNNIEDLCNNQKVVKTLYKNEKLFKSLDVQLRRLQASEDIILSFWEEDIFQSILKQDAFNLPYAPKISAWANKNPFLIELSNCTRLISLLGTNLYLSIGALSLPLMGAATVTEHSSLPSLKAFNEQWGLGAMSILSVTGLFFYLLKQKHDNKWTQGCSHIIGGPMGAMSVLYLEDHLHGIVTFKKCLQAKLISAAHYINGLKQISLKAQKNSILKECFPAITLLNEELNTLSNRSQEIKQLLGLLNTNTFKGNPRFLSLYGRMYVAYNLLHKIKADLVHAMIAAGELDVYMSCARILKECNEKNIPYCFPEYITNATTPTLAIQDFWNPAIHHKKAITNSITIGNPHHRQNIIVTGPNAGGKSTTIKGLIISIIMAQSLGIAPASSMEFTPFNRIMTYLNITDDIAAGNSHFKAGVLRARDLIKTAQSQHGANFSFTAVDEVFNGTTHKEGQAAAYALIEELGKCTHNICVTVTHFPELTQLEKRTNAFSNYKVTVTQNNNGLIHYPYKLESGISDQTIALDILKQEGFGDTFLEKAQKILKVT